MSAAMQTSAKRNANRAWIILFVLGNLLALSSASIIFSASRDTSDFEATTDVAFESLQPAVATYFLRLLRLIGAGFLGFALFASVVAFLAYRKGERWSWYAMWILPLVLAATAAIFMTHDAQALGLYYGGAALLAVAGLLLPMGKFFSRGAQ